MYLNTQLSKFEELRHCSHVYIASEYSTRLRFLVYWLFINSSRRENKNGVSESVSEENLTEAEASRL